MNYEQVTMSYVDAPSYPGIPFAPYSDEVLVSHQVRSGLGHIVTLLKAPGECFAAPASPSSGWVRAYRGCNIEANSRCAIEPLNRELT